jgi:hypothetical protein
LSFKNNEKSNATVLLGAAMARGFEKVLLGMIISMVSGPYKHI